MKKLTEKELNELWESIGRMDINPCSGLGFLGQFPAEVHAALATLAFCLSLT